VRDEPLFSRTERVSDPDQGAGKGSETGQGCVGADVGSIALIVTGDSSAQTVSPPRR